MTTRLWDNRIRLATPAFYYDYSDIQVLQYIPVQHGNPPVATLVQNFINGATAKLWAWDTDMDVSLNGNFTIAPLHSEFGSTMFCDPLMGSCTATNPAIGRSSTRTAPLPRASGVSGNLYAE